MELTSSKSKKPSILVVLNQGERELLFPGALTHRLSTYVPESDWISPDADFPSILRKVNPQILLASWSLPTVTESILADCPALAYFCYVAGSVRARMARVFWERGGVASNWGNVISNTIAECALTLVLSCLREAPRFYREMHLDKVWCPLSASTPRSLFNRKVGIYGFGYVARELIKLLAPFEVEIQAWSAPVPLEVYEQAGVRSAKSLRDLFADNEILICVEALTPETEGSVNQIAIEALKPGSVFVNVGRGKVVDEAALARRAVCGDISVGLDVYETQPLPADSPLRGLPNATLFPHTAGPTNDRAPFCGKAALDNLDAYLAGKPLLQPFTAEMYDRAT